MSKTKSKPTKIFIRVFAPLVVLLVLFFAFERGTQIWLNTQLPELLNQNPDRKYNINFDHAKLNFFKKQIVINGIEIVPVNGDSIKSNRATVFQFRIEKPDFKKLFSKKEIETKKLLVVAPKISIFPVENKVNEHEQELNDFWKDVFTRLSISDFEIRNAGLKVFGDDAKVPVFSFINLDLKVSGFEIDTSTIKNPFPVNFEKIFADCRGIAVKVDTLANLKVDRLELTNSKAMVQNFQLIPLLSAEQFKDLKSAKNDWLKIGIAKLNLNNFKWKVDKLGANFKVSSLQLDSTSLHAFTDQRFPKKNNGYKPLLAEMLRSLPFTFSLDSFLITNSIVKFETQAKNGNPSSLIFFNSLYASGYHLHNDLNQTKRTEFDIIARFMDEANIKASFNMNVHDQLDRFHIEGEMGDMSTETLNEILQPLAGVETVGQIYGVGFNIYGNNKHANGTLDFEYEGLKVKVLKQYTGEKNYLLSALSNIALRKSNLISDKRFRQGSIDLDREVQKSVLGFMWDAIKDGMIDTLVPFNLEKMNKNKRKKFFNKRSEH